MLKYNSQSILSLKDEPLKKEHRAIRFNKGKENQKSNIMFNDLQNDEIEQSFGNDLNETTKKKFKRSVLRREAEKSFPKVDDLVWDPSFISIKSLSQLQSNASKTEDSQFHFKVQKNVKEMNEDKNGLLQKQESAAEVTIDFIDEVAEICTALSRRPVLIAPIERLARLQSRPDFKFHNLVDVNYQSIGSACLMVTTNLAKAAQNLVHKIFVEGDIRNIRELNALLLSLQILDDALLDNGIGETNQKKAINVELLFDLAKSCLNELKNNAKLMSDKTYCEIIVGIQEFAKKLYSITQSCLI